METSASKSALDLFDLLSDVAEYGVDIAGSIPEEIFFDSLYVSRQQEKQINRLIKNKNHFVLVVGARGTGKTTIARALTRSWQKDQNKIICYIDVRNDPQVAIITQMLATNAEQERIRRFGIDKDLETNNLRLAQRLLNAISDRYKELFPMLSEDGKRIGENFLKVLVEIYNPTIKRQRSFADFAELRDRIALLYSVQNNGFSVSFKKWLCESWRTETFLQEDVLSYTYNNLRVQHWTHLANKILDIDKQIIWVDNIDALTAWQQSNVHSALTYLFSHIRQNASVLVSVREQNIYKNYDYSEFGPFLYSKRIKLPVVTVGGHELNAFDISPVSNKEISNILKNRLGYILRENNKLNTYNLEFTPAELNKLLRLATKIKNVILNRKGIFLTNGSIREFLKLNIEFMRYLISTDENGDINFEDVIFDKNYHIGKMTNLFLFFLRLHSIDVTRYNIGEMYDLISASHKWSNNNETNTGHSINHLLLNVIWNLMLENPGDVNQAHKCATVEEVEKAMSRLGYSASVVKTKLFSLYGGSAAHSGLIEIQSKQIPHIERTAQISPDDIVNITMRGKVLVAVLSNTFSYTYASALHLEHVLSGVIGEIEPPRKFNLGNAISLLFPYLCDVAQMCIESLWRTHNERAYFSGKNWYRKYLLHFGVPITYTFSYKSQHHLGEPINHYRRALQFELMLNGILTFANSWGENDPEIEQWIGNVTVLGELFQETLQDIKNGNLANNITFRELFDIEK